MQMPAAFLTLNIFNHCDFLIIYMFFHNTLRLLSLMIQDCFGQLSMLCDQRIVVIEIFDIFQTITIDQFPQVIYDRLSDADYPQFQRSHHENPYLYPLSPPYLLTGSLFQKPEVQTSIPFSVPH